MLEMLFDTHVHLRPDDNPDEILGAARAAGVQWVLVAGTDMPSSRAAADIAGPRDDVFCVAGVHPHAASRCPPDLVSFRELVALPSTVAVGEIGLDYHYDYSPRDCQRHVFEMFLQLATTIVLPVVVHCREAHVDCLDLIRPYAERGLRFLIHSFTGDLRTAKRYLDLGGWLSFNGIITFRKADALREVVRTVPLDRILIETDSPYLAPAPYRGRENQPAYVVEVARRLAAERDLPFAEVARVTTANAFRFFELPDPAVPVG